MSHILRQLAAPDLLITTIEKIRYKLAKKGQLSSATEGDVHFLQYCYNSHSFVKALSRDIISGAYQPGVARKVEIKKGNKHRTVFVFNFVDRIVQSTLFTILAPYVARYVCPNIYSYLPGRNAAESINAYTHYLKTNKLIYIYKTDIESYTDNIPTGKESVLWHEFNELLNLVGKEEQNNQYLISLLESFLMPHYYNGSLRLVKQDGGLAQGSTITTIAANIYLNSLDKLIVGNPDVFYSRYGDDMVIAHTQEHALSHMADTINNKLAQLSLAHKGGAALFFLKNQTKAQVPACCYQSVSKIDYLGCSIQADGTVRLTKYKQKQLLSSIRKKIKACITLCDTLGIDDVGRCVCRSLNQSFNEKNIMSDKQVMVLIKLVNCRAQLKQIDYLIALDIAKLLSGIPSVKAFRIISYKKIRSQWGLRSLCHLKNQK